MIVVLALLLVSSLIDPMALGTDMNLYLAVIILELLVYALPAVFFCRLRGKEYGRRLRVRPFRFSHFFLILLALILLLTGPALLNMGMYSLFPVQEQELSGYAELMNAGLYAVLAFCILPAVAEEFLFRSILIAEYEAVSPLFAILVSSLFFGMIHMDFRRLPGYVLAGIVLALVFYITRSVFASILLHILNNIAALWTDAYTQKFASIGIRGVLLSFILICLFMIALILFFWEGERIYQEYGENGVPSPHVRRRKRGEPSGAMESLTSLPFIAFVLMYIVFTLLKG